MANILLVSESKSFIISSVIEQLEGHRHKLFQPGNNPSEIGKIKEELNGILMIVDEKLMSRVLEGLAPQFIIDEAAESEDLPVSVRILYKALRDKVDVGDLALVAFTGDYNDLENKPESFPVQEHTHNSNDIIDLEDSVEQDFDDFLDDLIESL